MRYKGTIAEWNDERGFGFIKPAEGGERVFCHIKAFQDRSKRPALNTTVTYDLGKDDRGRPQARQIRYGSAARREPEARASAAPTSSRLTMAVLGSSVFLVAVAVAFVMGRTDWWVLPWYVVLSVLTFVAYGWDKVSAKGGHWRTQESTLHLMELIGGWPGAWIAQHAWRHKSRKESFQAAFQMAAAVNFVAFVGLVVWGKGIAAFFYPE